MINFNLFLRRGASLITVVALMSMALPMRVQADNTAQALPFNQDWTDTDLISADDNWSGVPGFTGYRGDGLTGATGVDPQTVVADGTSTPVDVTANQTNPNTFTTGGVAEFHLANPVVAFQGSGTARAPFLLLNVNTTGLANIAVVYNLRDIDGSADNSIQPVALQYRVGSSGNFTNLPAGFVADASTGPSLAVLITPVSVILPAAADNQPLVQIRIITTDAVGSDELIGVDDISVTGSVEDLPPSVSGTSPANGVTGVAVNTNITVNFNEAVDVAAGAITVECPTSNVVASNALADNVTSVVIDPAGDLPFSTTCDINVSASGVTDDDANDPPDNMAANFNSSFSTTDPTPPASDIVISQVYGGGGNTGAIYTHDFIELYNRGLTAITITGWSIQYASSTGTSWSKTDLTGTIEPGQYYLIQEAQGAGGTTPLPTPNAVGIIAMSATNGKVVLLNTNTLITSGTSCPTGATVVDIVGYGSTANCFEGGPTANLSNTTAALRKSDGAQDTNNNNADFDIGAPNPRNTPPSTPDLTINNVSANEGNAGTTAFDFTVSLSSPAGAGGVAFDIATADNSATVADNDYATNVLVGQFIAAGGSTYTFTVFVNGDATNEPDETFFVNVTNVTGANLIDGQGQGTIVNDDVDFCAQTFTPIYSIQGSGMATTITGTVTTLGVVVGDFEGTASASGFYLQDATGDGDPSTSDGIFVFTGSSNLVNLGDVVRVTGFARERFNQTTLNGSNSNTSPVPAGNIVNCGTGSVAVTDVTLPFADATYPERYEGMVVRFPQSLVIAEYFNYDRFGEIVLALPLAGEVRPFNGTSIDEPGAAANARTLANSLSRITLDDAQSAQNPVALRHPNGATFTLSNLFRGGDLVQNAVGVLGFDFSLYRLVPTGPADYTSVNPRPASPEAVGGTLRVAAMNTLNFFVTADYPTGNPLDNKCGPANNVECRGWDSDQSDEFTRQRDKLLTALAGLDADIIGLNELENSTGVEPLDTIVAGLPGYDYIDTGPIGTDAIKVGFIYRPAVVTPIGAFQILDTSDDPRFLDTKNRPALAQTFEVNATGARFTVVVNHFKSKGSDCNDVGDPDLLDGQGNCSQTRKAAAQALVDWLATDPTGSGDPDFLIVGDLNSYAMEESIDAIIAGPDDLAGSSDDYTNLISHFHGPYAYSYTFDGQAGYLDHALASASIFSQITGAADWHINSDESDVLDYDTSFKPAEQDALYEVNPYRTSDHDPVIVGLNLNVPPTLVVAPGGACASSGGTLNLTLADVNGDTLTLSGASSDTSVVPNANIVFGGSGANRTVTLTAIPAGTVRTATITVTVSDGLATAETTITVIVGTSGHNTSLTGTSGTDLILGLSGNDLLSGLAGHDVLCGGSGNNLLNGGDDDDTLVGDSGKDIMNGDNGNDHLLGDGGNDGLTGGNGNDVLDGGSGNDLLSGGAGDDSLLGESGNDLLTGGANADFFSGGTGNDVATDFNAGAGDTQDGTIP